MVAAKAAKPLGTLALVALIFFDVAGTPAGCENAVVAAGALPVPPWRYCTLEQWRTA